MKIQIPPLRFVRILLVVTPLLVSRPAFVQALPQITPTGEVHAAREIRVAFDTAQTPDNANPAATVTCTPQTPKGSGQWASGTEWAFSFGEDLPIGSSCTVAAPNGQELGKFSVVAQPAVDACNPDGPTAQSVSFSERPRYDRDRELPVIPEKPTIIVEFACPVSDESIAHSIFLDIDETVDPIPLDIITGKERESVLCKRKLCEKENAIVLSPRLTLPADSEGRLIIRAGLQSATGFATAENQSYPFAIRPSFAAQFYCDETYADGSCNPYLPIYLGFTEQPELSYYNRPQLKNASTEQLIQPKQHQIEHNQHFGYYYKFQAPFVPNSDYEITLPKDITDISNRALPEDMTALRVRIGEIPGLAKFPAPFGILEHQINAPLPISLRRTEEELAVTTFSLELNRQEPREGDIDERIPTVVRTLIGINRRFAKNAYESTTLQAGLGKFFTRASTTLKRTAGGERFETAGIPLERAGFHVVEVQSQKLPAQLNTEAAPAVVTTAVLKSDIAVHAKLGGDRSLIWTTDLQSGEVVAGATVALYDCLGKVLATGTSDSNGMVWIERRLENSPYPSTCYPSHSNDDYLASEEKFKPRYIVAAWTDNDFSFVLSSWDQGIEAWRFGLYPSNVEYGETAYHTVLSRNLLKRGETVRMKHVARQRTMAGFALFPKEKLPPQMALRHQGSDESYTAALTWNENGTADAEIPLPAHAKLGDYSIVLVNKAGNDTYTGTLSVEDYRLPALRGYIKSVSADKLVPEIEMGVSFLAGGAAAGLPVKLRYQVEPYRFTFSGKYADFAFGDDAEGSLNPTPERMGEERDWSESETYQRPAIFTHSVELDRAGTARLTLSELAAPKVPGQIRISAEYRDPAGSFQSTQATIPVLPGKYHVGLKLDSWANVKDQFRFEVAVLNRDGTPAADVPVTVNAFQRQVYSHRKKLIGGSYAYENQVYDRPLDGEVPTALCRAQTDSFGIAQCNARISASGNIILVASAQDSIGQSQSASSVWVANGDEWWFAQADNDRIDILPEKSNYEPGEKAKFQIRMPFRSALTLITVEREGVVDAFIQKITRANPIFEMPVLERYGPNIVVSALVIRGRNDSIQPLGMVDLGKPSVKLGMTKLRVGSGGYALRVDVTTEKKDYQVRETVRGTVQVQTPDRKRPSDRGIYDGEVAIAVIDEALLELKRNDTWKLLDAMTGERESSISTVTSGMYIIGKRHFGQKALPFGGGGGELRSREIFDPEVYWSARVPLDRTGKAQFEFPLKDSLSRFRVVAVATAGSYLFGTGATTIRATQDLMIVSGTPPIARVDDNYTADWTLRNTTDQPMSVEVKGAVSGDGWQHQIAKRNLEIAAGDNARIEESIRIPNVSNLQYDLQARANTGAVDRTKVSQIVMPRLLATVHSATLRQLQPADPWVEKLFVPETALPGTPQAEIAASGSLVDSLRSVFSYMLAYPYSCFEQRISKAIATDSEAAWSSIHNTAGQYLASTGLACYFPGCERGSEILTAYALRASAERGWKFSPQDETKMRNALLQFVQGKLGAFVDGGLTTSASESEYLRQRKISALEALSHYQTNLAALILPLWRDLASLSDVSLIQLTRAVSATADLAEKTQRLSEIRSILRARLKTSGTTVRLRGEVAPWAMEDQASTLAQLLLLALNDGGDLLPDSPRIVRSLIESQTHGRWALTTANALGTVALKKFATAFEKNPVSGSLAVTAGGLSPSIDFNATTQPTLLLPLRAGPSEVSLLHTGTGAPWATVTVRAAVPLTEPMLRGFQYDRVLSPVEQKTPGRWSVGDLVKVELTSRSDAIYNWVVIHDPLPAGASVVRSANENHESSNWITFEEKLYDSYRAYFEEVTPGVFKASYVMRLNTAGTYQLPNSRTEAMYAPEVFAELPLSTFVIEP